MNGRIDNCAYEFGELDVNEQIFCCRVRRHRPVPQVGVRSAGVLFLGTVCDFIVTRSPQSFLVCWHCQKQ